jgi:hypothetical protein
MALCPLERYSTAWLDFGKNSLMQTLMPTSIRRAKPRANRYDLSCAKTRGLILRVLSSGKKVWLFRARSDGHDNQIRLSLWVSPTFGASGLSDGDCMLTGGGRPARPRKSDDYRALRLLDHGEELTR